MYHMLLFTFLFDVHVGKAFIAGETGVEIESLEQVRNPCDPVLSPPLCSD
jgi:hypothetical protein